MWDHIWDYVNQVGAVGWGPAAKEDVHPFCHPTKYRNEMVLH